MERRVEIRPGVTQINSRVSVSLRPIDPYKGVVPSDTSDHEGIHAALLALRGRVVKRASRIPGPGYLGVTESDAFDSVAAIGPHAHGKSGTGWDVHLLELTGSDQGIAEATARTLIATNSEKIHAVASEIELNGSVGHAQIVRAMERVDNPEAEVEVNGPKGKRNFITKIRKVGGHSLPYELELSPEELPQAA